MRIQSAKDSSSLLNQNRNRSFLTCCNSRPIQKNTPPAKQDPEQEKEEAADVHFMHGMYTSVLLAAFGKVEVTLGPDTQKDKAKVHPAFLCLACFPLFVMQCSAIIAIRLDMDWHAKVGQMGSFGVLAPVKLLMIFIIQLLSYGYLMISMKLLVFILNPLTWLEIKRPQRLEWVPNLCQDTACVNIISIMGTPGFLSPWAIFALLLKLMIGYLVCIDSVSVILQSKSVQDTIFNALAIAFLADLHLPYWSFVRHIFQLHEAKDGEDLVFAIDRGVWNVETRTLSNHGRETTFMPGCMNKIAKCCPFFTRAGGAAVMEDLLPFLMILMVYVREIFVVAQAFDTTVLPAVRDVCTIWRWQNNKGDLLWSRVPQAVVFFEDHVSLVSVRNKTELLERTMALAYHEPCLRGGRFFRMMSHDYATLSSKYPLKIGAGILMVILILFGHRISGRIMLSLTSGNRKEKANDDEETAGEE